MISMRTDSGSTTCSRRSGMKMRFDYDFGDGWKHDVFVEAISLPQR